MSDQRSLRGSTLMIRRATDCALSQAAEHRALRQYSHATRSIGIDAPPAIRRDSSWDMDRNGWAERDVKDSSSLLKACLLPPTRRPSPLKTPPEKGHKSTNTTSQSSRSIALSSRIERLVRNAYRDVKSDRSSKRETLVRYVLSESLDQVVMLGFSNTHSDQHSISRLGANDRESLVEKNEHENQHSADDRSSRSRCDENEQETKKQKKGKNEHKNVRKRTSKENGNVKEPAKDGKITKVGEAHKNGNQKYTYSDQYSSTGKRKQVHESTGDDSTSPHRKSSKNHAYNVQFTVSQANQTENKINMSNQSSSNYAANIIVGAVESSMQRMVFPRLPSNSCNMHPLFQFPFCFSTMQSLGAVYEGTLMEEQHTNSFNAPSEMSFSQPFNLASKDRHKNLALTIKLHAPSARTESSSTRHQPLLIEGTHPPRPSSSSVITLKSFFCADDERNLAHVPYFGDETCNDGDIDWDLFDVGERMKLYEYGPPYRETETIETIDEVLKLLAGREPSLFYDIVASDFTKAPVVRGDDVDRKVPPVTQTVKLVHSFLAELSDVKVERVQERHIICFGHKTSDKKSKVKMHHAKEDNHDSPSRTHKKNSAKEDPASYEEAVDSYRDLFCRRCFTYDCQIHGNLPKSNLQLLGELAMQKDREGHWNELDEDLDLDNFPPRKSDQQKKRGVDESGSLPSIKQAICERAFVIFRGDVEKIAKALDATPKSVSVVVAARRLELQPPKFVSLVDTSKKKKGKPEMYHSMKNYNPKWLNNIQSCEIHPAFIPCDHVEPCAEETCSCVQNKFFCNKACGWGSKSRNFFRGCACKAGQCRSSTCPCWAANRECDPDLCRTCGACADPPQQPANKQRCRNDNISMRRHAHLLVAASSIQTAGWGLYTKHALKKGDFIHEYIGEVISQEEAERRGIIYDKEGSSYLFNLSSDFTVDATRKGNKTRYANHSSSAPNCEAKMIRVNGDMRIGLFAKVDIDAQTELFFDYRYDEHLDNDLIIKPAHKFHWMNSPSQKTCTKSATIPISIKAAKKNAY
ncbi:hypothetical protein ACHAW6_008523 [Cyclotella cf. meneghiniana]